MRLTITVIVCLSGLILVGCSSGSLLTRGTIVMKTVTEAHIDLGSEDSLQVGDTLAVLRNESHASSRTRLVWVGTARVVKILDGTHAAIVPLTGTLEERDIVGKKAR